MRERICTAAVKAAKAVGYVGAGEHHIETGGHLIRVVGLNKDQVAINLDLVGLN